MLEWLEAHCSNTHLQQVFWETHQRLHLLCACLPHWIRYNLNIAATVPQTMLLPSPCTLLFPTWKIRTPMWECCFVDYSSAFNTIVPATLVAKLQTLGLNRSLCSLILDVLKGRSQVVRMGNKTSSPLILNTGAPPVLPAHTWLHSHTQLQRHHQISWWHKPSDCLITDNDEMAYREEVFTLTNGAFPLHGTTRFGSARYGSIRVGLVFHCSLVPL